MFVNVLLDLVSSGRRLFGNQMIINVTVLGEGGRASAIQLNRYGMLQLFQFACTMDTLINIAKHLNREFAPIRKRNYILTDTRNNLKCH